ncbi:hypothetical protein V6N13_107055 [Hibiscus sabdariffa]
MRKQHNHISAIKLSDGTWCHDDASLRSEVIAYFRSLFTIDCLPQGSFLIIGAFSSIPETQLAPLTEVPFCYEIYLALKSMASLKAPDLMSNGSWNLEILNAIFPADFVSHIISIRCPHTVDIDNLCIWRWATHHKFEVRSAYSSLQQDSWDEVDPTWSFIWSLTIPQRMHVFLWTTLRQKFMTNIERVKRSLSSDPTCPICGAS